MCRYPEKFGRYVSSGWEAIVDEATPEIGRGFLNETWKVVRLYPGRDAEGRIGTSLLFEPRASWPFCPRLFPPLNPSLFITGVSIPLLTWASIVFYFVDALCLGPASKSFRREPPLGEPTSLYREKAITFIPCAPILVSFPPLTAKPVPSEKILYYSKFCSRGEFLRENTPHPLPSSSVSYFIFLFQNICLLEHISGYITLCILGWEAV